MKFVTRQRRTLVAAAAATFASVLAVAGFGSPAAAATGYGLDGLDPYATGCATNASVVASATVYNTFAGPTILGTAKLWYSWSCGTNWVSVKTSVSSNGPSGYLITDVTRWDPNHGENYTWSGSYPSGASSWGNMVYAPATCAWGDVVIGNSAFYGSVQIQDPTC